MINISYENLRLAEEQALPGLKQLLETAELSNILEYISYNRDVEEMDITLCVVYCILGILPLSRFTYELIERTGISLEEATYITSDVHKYIIASFFSDLSIIQESAEQNYQIYNQSTQA